MQEQPTIIVKLKLGQPIHTEVKGMKGEGCKALTKPLQAMGDVENFTAKPELYEQPATQTNVIQQRL
ncbi:MAG: hypothetical protein SFY66_11860 [Oculatellaceae cyanobacterium bins.114]|nr:hypothetical protein [Oculatellaceae cyanobacterium bins.114]